MINEKQISNPIENVSNYSCNTGTSSNSKNKDTELVLPIDGNVDQFSEIHDNLLFHGSKIPSHELEEMENALCNQQSTKYLFKRLSVNQTKTEVLFTHQNSLRNLNVNNGQGRYSSPHFSQTDINEDWYETSEIKLVTRKNSDKLKYLDNVFILSQDVENVSNTNNNVEVTPVINTSFIHEANSCNTNRAIYKLSNKQTVHYASDFKVMSQSKENLFKDVLGSKRFVEGDFQFQNDVQLEPKDKIYKSSSDDELKSIFSFVCGKESHNAALKNTHEIKEAMLSRENKYNQFPHTNFETIVMNVAVEADKTNSANLNDVQPNENSSNSTEPRNMLSHNQNINDDQTSANNKISEKINHTSRASKDFQNRETNKTGIDINFDQQIHSNAKTGEKVRKYRPTGKYNNITFDSMKEKSNIFKKKTKNVKNGEATVDNPTYLQIFEHEKGLFKTRVAIISGETKQVEEKSLNINEQFEKGITSSEEILGVHTIKIISQFKGPNSSKKAGLHHTIKIESNGFKSTNKQIQTKPSILGMVKKISNVVTSKIMQETNDMLQKLSKHNYKNKDGNEQKSRVKELNSVEKKCKCPHCPKTKHLQNEEDKQKSESVSGSNKKPNGTTVDDIIEDKKYETCINRKCVKCLEKKSTANAIISTEKSETIPVSTLSKSKQKLVKPLQISLSKISEKSEDTSSLKLSPITVEENKKNATESVKEDSIETKPKVDESVLKTEIKDNENASFDEKSKQKSDEIIQSSLHGSNHEEIKENIDLIKRSKTDYSKISDENTDNISPTKKESKFNDTRIPKLSQETEVNSNLLDTQSPAHSALSIQSSKDSSLKTSKSKRQPSFPKSESESVNTSTKPTISGTISQENALSLKQQSNTQGSDRNIQTSKESSIRSLRRSSEKSSTVAQSKRRSSESPSFSGKKSSASYQKTPLESPASNSSKSPSEVTAPSIQDITSSQNHQSQTIPKISSPLTISQDTSLKPLPSPKKSSQVSTTSSSQDHPSKSLSTTEKSLSGSISYLQKHEEGSVGSNLDGSSTKSTDSTPKSSLESAHRHKKSLITTESQSRGSSLGSTASKSQKKISWTEENQTQKSSLVHEEFYPDENTMENQSQDIPSVSTHVKKNTPDSASNISEEISSSLASQSQIRPMEPEAIKSEEILSASTNSHSQDISLESGNIQSRKASPFQKRTSESRASKSSEISSGSEQISSQSTASESPKISSGSELISSQSTASESPEISLGSVPTSSQKIPFQSTTPKSADIYTGLVLSFSQKIPFQSTASISADRSTRLVPSPSHESATSKSAKISSGFVPSSSQKIPFQSTAHQFAELSSGLVPSSSHESTTSKSAKISSEFVTSSQKIPFQSTAPQFAELSSGLLPSSSHESATSESAEISSGFVTSSSQKIPFQSRAPQFAELSSGLLPSSSHGSATSKSAKMSSELVQSSSQKTSFQYTAPISADRSSGLVPSSSYESATSESAEISSGFVPSSPQKIPFQSTAPECAEISTETGKMFSQSAACAAPEISSGSVPFSSKKITFQSTTPKSTEIFSGVVPTFSHNSSQESVASKFAEISSGSLPSSSHNSSYEFVASKSPESTASSSEKCPSASMVLSQISSNLVVSSVQINSLKFVSPTEILVTSGKTSTTCKQSSESTSFEESVNETIKLKENTSVTNFKEMQVFHGILEEKSNIPVHFVNIKNDYPVYFTTAEKFKNNKTEVKTIQQDFQNQSTHYNGQNLILNQEMYSTSPNVKIIYKNHNLFPKYKTLFVYSSNRSKYVLHETSTEEEFTQDNKSEEEKDEDNYDDDNEEEEDDDDDEDEDDDGEEEEEEEEEEEDSEYEEDEESDNDDEEERERKVEDNRNENNDNIKIDVKYISSQKDERNNLTDLDNQCLLNNISNGRNLIKSDLKKDVTELKHTTAIGCCLGFYKLTSDGFVFDSCDVRKHKKSIPKSPTSEIKLSAENIKRSKVNYIEFKNKQGEINSKDINEYNLLCQEVNTSSKKSSSNKHIENCIPELSNNVQNLPTSTEQKSLKHSNYLCNSQTINTCFIGKHDLKQVHKYLETKAKKRDTDTSKNVLEIKNEQISTQLQEIYCKKLPHQQSKISNHNLNNEISSKNSFHDLQMFKEIKSSKINTLDRDSGKDTGFDDYRNKCGGKNVITDTYVRRDDFKNKFYIDNINNIEPIPQTFEIYDTLQPCNIQNDSRYSEAVPTLIQNIEIKSNQNHNYSKEGSSIDCKNISFLTELTDKMDSNLRSQSKIHGSNNKKHHFDAINNVGDFPKQIHNNKINSEETEIDCNNRSLSTEPADIASSNLKSQSKFLGTNNKKHNVYALINTPDFPKQINSEKTGIDFNNRSLSTEPTDIASSNLNSQSKFHGSNNKKNNVDAIINTPDFLKQINSEKTVIDFNNRTLSTEPTDIVGSNLKSQKQEHNVDAIINTPDFPKQINSEKTDFDFNNRSLSTEPIDITGTNLKSQSRFHGSNNKKHNVDAIINTTDFPKQINSEKTDIDFNNRPLSTEPTDIVDSNLKSQSRFLRSNKKHNVDATINTHCFPKQVHDKINSEKTDIDCNNRSLSTEPTDIVDSNLKSQSRFLGSNNKKHNVDTITNTPDFPKQIHDKINSEKTDIDCNKRTSLKQPTDKVDLNLKSLNKFGRSDNKKHNVYANTNVLYFPKQVHDKINTEEIDIDCNKRSSLTELTNKIDSILKSQIKIHNSDNKKRNVDAITNVTDFPKHIHNDKINTEKSDIDYNNRLSLTVLRDKVDSNLKSQSRYLGSDSKKHNVDPVINVPDFLKQIHDKTNSEFTKRKKSKESVTVPAGDELIELLKASSAGSIKSEKYISQEIEPIIFPKKEPDEDERKLLPRISIVVEDIHNAILISAPSWPKGTPDYLIKDCQHVADTIIRPRDITTNLKSGFRCDHLALSGDRCFIRRTEVETRKKKLIAFHGNEPGCNFMSRIGYSRETAKQLLMDKEFSERLRTAIREAAIWTQKLNRIQAGLIVLLAYIVKPKVMRYFLQLVEAISNKRITNSGQLNGFIEMLEKIEDGFVRIEDMYGQDV
ncbi:hypothetical protein L9F63_010015, partial [Diploptera punctata]